ncbi:cell division protein FtsA [Patescibacteria group bacterium]|nr:cell division protein FtsA [Patescibacteria group bacterium]
MKAQLIAGLDIGTRTLKMVLVRKGEPGSAPELVAMAEEPSAGVRKGTVMNADELSVRIASLKARLEQMAATRIEEVVVNLGGSHVYVAPSRGIVAVSRADSQVSSEDVERVLQAAQVLSLPPNYEVLDVFPQQFIVDGEAGIHEAAGMRGVRLEAEVLAVCSFAPYFRNLQTAVLGAGLGITDIVPSPLAAAAAVLTSEQKELGVAVVELGAGTTGLAVYEEGQLLHEATFPVGSNNITNDIAIGLRCEYETAERIKTEYGSCAPQQSRKTEKMELADGTHVSFPRGLLRQIIEARTKEIFQLVNGELKKIGRQGKLPAGAVLLGGGCKLPGIAEFARKELKLPARLGKVEGIEGFPVDPAFGSVAGLVLPFLEMREQGSRGGQGIFRLFRRLIKPFIP